MPTMVSQGSVNAASTSRALTAAAAMALPPRRPRRVTQGRPRSAAISASLLSAAPTNPTGNARMRGGPLGPLAQALEQMEQGRRRVADRDHGPGEVGPPQLDRGGRAGGAEVGGQRRRALVVERQPDLVPRRQARRHDARRNHARVDQDRCTFGQRRPAGRRPDRHSRRARRRRPACRRHGPAAGRGRAGRRGNGPAAPRRGSGRTTGRRWRPGRAGSRPSAPRLSPRRRRWRAWASRADARGHGGDRWPLP